MRATARQVCGGTEKQIMKMQVISKTHVGKVRNNNEDSLLIREPYLFAVADGMGGYAAGEIASRETLKAFELVTHKLRHGEGADARQILTEAFLKANEHIYIMAHKNAAYAGMGTTLTALYLPQEESRAYAAHVGDSRLYLYRQNKLSQLTHDHSYVADLVAQGKITDKEAFSHPQKNMLLQAIGVEEQIKTDIIEFNVQAGDILLLCSDGLSDMLHDAEIAAVLAQNNLNEAAEILIKKSLENGGRDNVSFILIALVAAEEDGCDETNDLE